MLKRASLIFVIYFGILRLEYNLHICLQRGEMLKLFILLLLSLSLCAQTITIAVATNVSYAMQEIKEEFSSLYPDIKVHVVLGSSGKLTAQIRNGAPYGLFMSANMKYPKALFQDGLALQEPVVYAQGTLAYFSVKPRDFSKGIALLKDENIEKIALANPKLAPYGIAARQALQRAKLYKSVKEKLVFAESISQTVSYVMTAADIGFIAKSLLYSKKMHAFKEDIHWLSVDTKLYMPIKQGVVLLKSKKNADAYKAFYNFVLGNEAKAIFKKYGYII